MTEEEEVLLAGEVGVLIPIEAENVSQSLWEEENPYLLTGEELKRAIKLRQRWGV